MRLGKREKGTTFEWEEIEWENVIQHPIVPQIKYNSGPVKLVPDINDVTDEPAPEPRPPVALRTQELTYMRVLGRLSRRTRQRLFPERDDERARPAGAAGARSVLGAIDLFVPSRISNEDIGDALELILRLEMDGSPPWKIYLKTASTVFWVFVNVFRELTSSLLGKKSAASSRNPNS